MKMLVAVFGFLCVSACVAVHPTIEIPRKEPLAQHSEPRLRDTPAEGYTLREWQRLSAAEKTRITKRPLPPAPTPVAGELPSAITEPVAVAEPVKADALTAQDAQAIARVAQQSGARRRPQKLSSPASIEDIVHRRDVLVDEKLRIAEELAGADARDSQKIQELKEQLQDLQAHADALANEVDFLSSLKSTNSDVTFSQVELDDLFVSLDLPHLSDDALQQMDAGELWLLESDKSGKPRGLIDRAKKSLKDLTPDKRQVLEDYLDSREAVVKKILDRRDAIKPENLSKTLWDIAKAPKTQRQAMTEDVQRALGEQSSSQATFGRKCLSYVEKFCDIQDGVEHATDIATMERLQDELRDVYEKVFRDSFASEDSEEFRKQFQQQSNELLDSLKKKLSALDNASNRGITGVARVRYSFARLWGRIKTFGIKQRYLSETAENQQGFGLRLVSFQIRPSEYVETVKRSLVPFDKAVKEIRQANSANQVAVADVSSALKVARQVSDQVEALRSVVACRGKVMSKQAGRWLNYSDSAIPGSGRVFIVKMTGVHGTIAKPLRDLAQELLESVPLGVDETAASRQEIAKSIGESLSARRSLTPSQINFLEKLYNRWFSRITLSLRAQNPQVDREALRILAKYNGADEQLLGLFKSDATLRYVMQAYRGKNVSLPTKMPQAVLTGLVPVMDGITQKINDAQQFIVNAQGLEGEGGGA